MTASKTRATNFRIDAAERTPAGFLRVKGNLTKVGVFEYAFMGGTVREMRSPEEVFRADSLDTLLGAPVTVDHPAGFVDVTNAGIVSVGNVIKVEARSPYVEGTLQITDAKTIALVEAGILVEVSLGYKNDPRERQDAREADFDQTNIVYNHAALGPSGWGRAGTDVRLRLDSNGDLDFSSFRMDANGRELLQNLDNMDEADLAIVLAHLALAL